MAILIALVIGIAVPLGILVTQLAAIIVFAVLDILGAIFGQLLFGRPIRANEIVGFAILGALITAGSYYAWVLLTPYWMFLVPMPAGWAFWVWYAGYREKRRLRRLHALNVEIWRRKTAGMSFREKINLISSDINSMAERLDSRSKSASPASVAPQGNSKTLRN